jgi:FtsH-binding integral membrane protein
MMNMLPYPDEREISTSSAPLFATPAATGALGHVLYGFGASRGFAGGVSDQLKRHRNRKQQRTGPRVMEREREEEPPSPQQQQQQQPGLTTSAKGEEGLTLKERLTAAYASPAASPAAPSVRQADAITAGAEAHLRKVWAITGANVGVASVGTIAGMTVMGGVSPLIPGLGALVPMIWLYSTEEGKDSEFKRTALLASFALLSGMSMGPLVGMSLAMDPMILPMSLGVTGGIFGAMTALSLVLPSGGMLKYGAPLGGGMMVLFGLSMVNAFIYPHPMLMNLSMYGGLALFTLFIAYDTQRIIADYEEGQRDAFKHSVDMFINLKAIFVRVMILFMGRDD